MRDGGAYGCAVPRAYANLNPGLDYIRQTPVLGDPNATAFLKAVLAPVMFNLYSNDLPLTRGRNFIYPDDMSRHSRPILQRTGIQSRQIWRGSHTCRQWRLKPSTSKTISSVFHLHNTSATRELSVYLDS